jgi:hypothetical protein
MKNILLSVLLVFAVAQCSGISPEANREEGPSPAFEKGREDATNDLKAGKFAYYLTGAPAPWDQLWAEKLRDAYGILMRTGGCNPDSEIFLKAKGYNTVSLPAIAEKYGDILGEVEKKAREEWENRQKKSK